MTTMTVRDVSLFVKVMGQGYPLLLMHGGPSLDHTTLLPLQTLAERFTLVFYDHRCNGRSNGAAVNSMTWENLTADADALRQELGFDRWAVLGHSFGGNVALEYALRYPDCISRLILMDTGGDQWWVQHNAPQLLDKRGYSPRAVQAARRFYNGQFAPGEFMTVFMKFMRAYYANDSLLGVARDMLSGHRPQMRPEVLIYAYSRLLDGWTVMDRLGEIQTPTLVLAGRYDFLFPPEHQAILADRLPNARLELVEHAGHNPHVEQGAVVTEIIQGFIGEVEAVAAWDMRMGA